MSVRTLSRSNIIYTIAVIGFIFVLHEAIPNYSNSSFLAQFTNEQTIGFIYMTGAALTILGFLVIPNIIRRFGNYRTTIFLICAQIVLFFGLISSTNPLMIAIIFIIETTIVALIGLAMDIFLEVYTSATSVGSVRGLFNATLNASWVVAPLIGSLLINGTNNYRNTYVASLAMLFPLLYLIYRNFPRFKDPNYIHLSPWQLAKHVSSNKSWVKLFFANIVLQTFYAWMTVYVPIYLNKTIGFGWEDIGIILVIMLIPFPLVEYPLGKLADRKYGEKEIMSLGFVVMAISTAALSLFTVKSLAFWAIGLFATRIGAAAVEIMMETYFFKTVSPRDSAVLGSFRITRPLSYFFAPVLMMVGLLFTNTQYMFVVVGLMCLIALYPAMTIRDTN